MSNTLSSLSGVNADLHHQIIISHALIGIDGMLKFRKKKGVMVLSETDIVYLDNSNDLQRKNADIVIWKYSKDELNGIENPILIIELTRTPFPQDLFNSKNKDIIKMNDYLDNLPSLKECYLFNYLSGTILKYTKNKNKETCIEENIFTTKYADIQLKRYLFPKL